MRIIYDGRVITPQARHGIARYAAGLLAELGREPGRHAFVVLTGPESEPTPEAQDPIDRARRAGFEIVPTGLAPYSLPSLLRLPGLVDGLKADLYYSPSFMPPAWGKTPAVFTIHDLIHLDSAADYPLTRRLAWRYVITPRARRARRVLTVSRTTAGILNQRLGVAADRTKVVPDGVEAAFRRREEAEVGPLLDRLGLKSPYLVSSGNPRPHKNLRTGTAAFHRLIAKGWSGSLVLVGAGTLALPQGPGRVIRAEGLTDAELAALYSGAEGAFFPSLAEGFGLPPLEAMACGCPVVVNDLPVMRELLGERPETKALLADPADEQTLSARLAELLADPSASTGRAKAARGRASEFSWARAAELLRAEFNALEKELRG